ATPVELAAIIARRLGLTGALGTVAEHVNGSYTGKLVGDLLHAHAKAHAVRALAAREGLDLRRCTAYSDSENDVPMLSVVGNAVGRSATSAPAEKRPRSEFPRYSVWAWQRAPSPPGWPTAGAERTPTGHRSAGERITTACELGVQSLLDRLADPIGQVECDARIVRAAGRIRVRADRLTEARN